MVGLLIGLGLALLFSGLLSAAELAIFSLPEARVRALADQGARGAAALAQLRARPERVLVLLRLGDAFADVAAGGLTALIAYNAFDVAYVALAVGGAAFAVLYFGELLPIGFAVNHGTRFALAIAAPLRVISNVLGPVLGVFAFLANLRADRRQRGTALVTESEIRQMTALGQSEGAITAHERELIERAFRMDETKAWDIMTPRVDMFAWDGSLRLSDIAAELGITRYSRVPVYEGTIDNVVGVLHVRDAYQALLGGQRDITLRTLAREPLIVPGSLSLTRLLREFQNRRIHIAIVVDEYGGTAGLVTVEDVVEELVGEIHDEYDAEVEPIVRESDDTYVFSAKVGIGELAERLGIEIEEGAFETVGGFVLSRVGRVPNVGERFEFEGLEVEILEAEGRRIHKVRVRRQPQPVEEGEA